MKSASKRPMTFLVNDLCIVYAYSYGCRILRLPYTTVAVYYGCRILRLPYTTVAVYYGLI